MTCAIHDPLLPKGKAVRVNGVQIPRDLIAREVQQHPSRTPAEAWTAAARALVVRELLLQEARRLNIAADALADDEGRRETDDEAAIRALVAHEVQTPKADTDSCRRYYEQNRRRFRSPDIFEAAHILFAADKRDAQSHARARAQADTALALLHEQPERFAELAQIHSACPSAAHGGNLGQITPGQTTPEFAQALNALAPGVITAAPVETRYGFHVIRLDRRIDGRELPFEVVADRVADYLTENVERRAIAQYVARLASQSAIEGVAIANADAMRVH
jgi:peptidyl-prolyl cis-trans isomerase C